MNLDDFAEFLDGEAARLEPTALPPLSPKAVKVVKILLSADIKRNFHESHDPEGNPWAPLKRPRPRGVKARARGGVGADKPLLDWGILMQSAAAVAHEQDVATINAIAGGFQVAFDRADEIRGHDGTVVGNWLRLGTSRGIPAREFLGVSADCAATIAEVTIEDAAEQLLR
jgi:Phage virion morphogenesis family